ncbi:hypothetical protein [Caproicibacterium sp. XB1]|uniref:hypothetical protein n=1 Tax=Caproicibacterium sp. XB1 TaxID=3396405 RepID=UPI0039B6F1AC
MATVKESIDGLNQMSQRATRLSQIAQGPCPSPAIHSDVDLKALRDSVSDPTGLRPHFERLNDNVQKIDSGLELEREERQKADEKASTVAARWHRIDLTIAVIGVIIGVLGLVFGIVF